MTFALTKQLSVIYLFYQPTAVLEMGNFRKQLLHCNVQFDNDICFVWLVVVEFFWAGRLEVEEPGDTDRVG